MWGVLDIFHHLAAPPTPEYVKLFGTGLLQLVDRYFWYLPFSSHGGPPWLGSVPGPLEPSRRAPSQRIVARMSYGPAGLIQCFVYSPR
jgi:hypothetical protein